MSHNLFMRRCFDLARLGAGSVSPNPMVGAVLVHNNRIIGEGYHQKYGEAHAEVNAIRNVMPEAETLLEQATLYVSLEPCCIYGRTPPCTNLILDKRIPKVVISCLDATPGVSGRGVQILREAGVEVITGILEEEGKELAAIRNTFVQQERPYIILKYAQSLDGFLAQPGQQTWISNAYSKRLVHKWRSEVAAILVGTNTAAIDNPQLTNRLYPGSSPLRIAFDKTGRLSPTLHLFDDSTPTWIITERLPAHASSFQQTQFIQLDFGRPILPQLLKRLYEEKKNTLLVEGGRHVLEEFLQQGLWDEARVFVGNRLLYSGVQTPVLPTTYQKKKELDGDFLYIYRNSLSTS